MAAGYMFFLSSYLPSSPCMVLYEEGVTSSVIINACIATVAIICSLQMHMLLLQAFSQCMVEAYYISAINIILHMYM
jgi:hypothetical protein